MCVCVCVTLSRAKIHIQYASVIPGMAWHKEQDTVSIHVLCVRYLMKRDLIEPNGLQCPIRFSQICPSSCPKGTQVSHFFPMSMKDSAFPNLLGRPYQHTPN